MGSDANRRLERLAAEQGTLFTRPQAYACGIPKSTVEHRVSTGQWVIVGLDVLRIAAVPLDDDLRLRAATLALRSSAVSHESAAREHGLRYVPTGRLTVAVPDRQEAHRGDDRRHGQLVPENGRAQIAPRREHGGPRPEHDVAERLLVLVHRRVRAAAGLERAGFAVHSSVTARENHVSPVRIASGYGYTRYGPRD